RRCPFGIRRRREHGPVTEQSAPLIEVGKRHPAESAAVDPRNPVVASQTLVDERVVGTEQIANAAVLAQRAREKQLCLLLERLKQAVIEVRVDIGVDDDLTHATEVEPLRAEVV